jgi:hypothetical protein
LHLAASGGMKIAIKEPKRGKKKRGPKSAWFS